MTEPMARTATFTATAEARPRGGIAIRLPVDPATIWGERERYYVSGTIERYSMRGVGTVSPFSTSTRKLVDVDHIAVIGSFTISSM